MTDQPMRFTINCDVGEGFGRYTLADDKIILPLIDMANIACGFHASDPVIMQRTVALAHDHGAAIGAHPSLPDLQGFGRREMKLERTELAAMLRYQIGALKGFIDGTDAQLGHIKPHGALYGMACRDEIVAHAICDAAEPFDVPLLGLAGTLQETIYRERGFDFVAEFYVDLEYNDDGLLIIGRAPHQWSAQQAADRARRAMTQGVVAAQSGREIEVQASSLCVHSDSGNAVEVLTALRDLETSDHADR